MDVSGILYRVWAVGGVIALLGLLCLLIACCERGNEKNRETVLAGVLCLMFGLILAGYYAYCAWKPEIATFSGELDSVYRNSRVAPPLPLTMEYTLYDETGRGKGFYLDVLSKKTVFPSEPEIGKAYRITYETRTDIILKLEPAE